MTVAQNDIYQIDGRQKVIDVENDLTEMSVSKIIFDQNDSCNSSETGYLLHTKIFSNRIFRDNSDNIKQMQLPKKAFAKNDGFQNNILKITVSKNDGCQK